jgi:predicted ATPase
MPPVIQRALWSLGKTLTQISYLGPLRSPAKRFYVAHLEADEELDATGELLPYILRDRGDRKVVNVPRGLREAVPPVALSEALNQWLYYLRTGEQPRERSSDHEILLDTTKQVLVQINIKGITGGDAYAIADSGFGYSQVLPILVRGLLAPPDSTLIVEQPELHLNPALQVRLAEFFISMVRAGKQVLLETHSEHLVNAIRVLSAEDESTGLNDKCRIYFLDAEPGRPVVHTLSIRPDGTVPEWPKHFFGEAITLSGRLLRAQKRFRKSGAE